MCGSVSCSDVAGRRALALAAGQREGRLALGLSEAAGEAGEGFDQRASVCDRHLPEFELLSARPLLRRVLIHLPPLAQVTLIPQHHHHHLFFVSGLVDLLLQELDSSEGLQAVDAVDQHEAVRH